MPQLLRERFRKQKPLEDLEVALVRASLASPGALPPREEARLRWALGLAKLHSLRVGRVDVPLEHEVVEFRDELLAVLRPLFEGERVELAALAAIAPSLARRVGRLRAQLLRRHADRVPPERLDEELREKKLVLALGGGGGTGFVYIGAFQLIEELGLRPSLLAGTSMGSILGLFRARREKFDAGETASVLRGLSYRRLFRVLDTGNRYGLPAALRLYLRTALGRYFTRADGEVMSFRDLPIPMLITMTGIHTGMLPRPIESYERLLDPRELARAPWRIRQKITDVVVAIAELLARPQVLATFHAGYEGWTSEMDVLDAAGFSSSVPGVIHYDVMRDDPKAHDMLRRICREKEITRFIDGGVTDNVPARAAWRWVQRGKLGNRNALVVGLDAFAPRLSNPIWLPLQRIAAENVRASLKYAHLTHSFRHTLSPVDLVPRVDVVLQTAQVARAELLPLVPALTRLLAPLPPLQSLLDEP